MDKKGKRASSKPVKLKGHRLLQLFILLILLVPFPGYVAAETAPIATEADAQFNAGNYDAAFENYNRLVQQNPDRKEYYFNRGLCLYKTGKFEQAIADFNQSLLLDTGFAQAKLMRALALEKQGNIKAAITAYKGIEEDDTINSLLNRRIKNYQLAVWLSNKWYYMVAIMLVVILLMAVVAKSVSYKKW